MLSDCDPENFEGKSFSEIQALITQRLQSIEAEWEFPEEVEAPSCAADTAKLSKVPAPSAVASVRHDAPRHADSKRLPMSARRQSEGKRQVHSHAGAQPAQAEWELPEEAETPTQVADIVTSSDVAASSSASSVCSGAPRHGDGHGRPLTACRPSEGRLELQTISGAQPATVQEAETPAQVADLVMASDAAASPSASSVCSGTPPHDGSCGRPLSPCALNEGQIELQNLADPDGGLDLSTPSRSPPQSRVQTPSASASEAGASVEAMYWRSRVGRGSLSLSTSEASEAMDNMDWEGKLGKVATRPTDPPPPSRLVGIAAERVRKVKRPVLSAMDVDEPGLPELLSKWDPGSPRALDEVGTASQSAEMTTSMRPFSASSTREPSPDFPLSPASELQSSGTVSLQTAALRAMPSDCMVPPDEPQQLGESQDPGAASLQTSALRPRQPNAADETMPSAGRPVSFAPSGYDCSTSWPLQKSHTTMPPPRLGSPTDARSPQAVEAATFAPPMGCAPRLASEHEERQPCSPPTPPPCRPRPQCGHAARVLAAAPDVLVPSSAALHRQSDEESHSPKAVGSTSHASRNQSHIEKFAAAPPPVRSQRQRPRPASSKATCGGGGRSLPCGMVDPVSLIMDDYAGVLPVRDDLENRPDGAKRHERQRATHGTVARARGDDRPRWGDGEVDVQPESEDEVLRSCALGARSCSGSASTASSPPCAREMRAQQARKRLSVDDQEDLGASRDRAAENFFHDDPALPLTHKKRVGGRNWRGVDRPADHANKSPDAGVSPSASPALPSRSRRTANRITEHEASGVRLPGRWGAVALDPEHKPIVYSWGPARGKELGCEKGLSTQYSCRSESWWKKSMTAEKRRQDEFEGSILPSQRPLTPDSDEDVSRGIRRPCNCPADVACCHWPSGRPLASANLPPLRGAEGGKAQSLGLSLAPPPPAPKVPTSLHRHALGVGVSNDGGGHIASVGSHQRGAARRCEMRGIES
mmetsp:Transcript_116604/g.329796  ORF Transcript_116604/g.329796 Transcript_116604/m.329796 type:complete len:989 (+) Transcript_116604:84-3050(+)